MDKKTQKEILKIVRKNYDEAADIFNDTRNRIGRSWDKLKELIVQVEDGSKILDVGCGNGRLLEIMGNKPVNYLGIDNSEKLLSIAREKINKNDSVVFKHGDILHLGKIEELDFDWVFCVAVLHHIPGKDLRLDAIRQLRNKINIKGRIVISVWNLWGQEKYRKIIFRYWLLKFIKKNKMDIGDILFDWKKGDGTILTKRYYHAFTKRELKRLVHRANLKIEKFIKDKYNYYLVLKK